MGVPSTLAYRQGIGPRADKDMCQNHRRRYPIRSKKQQKAGLSEAEFQIKRHQQVICCKPGIMIRTLKGQKKAAQSYLQ